MVKKSGNVDIGISTILGFGFAGASIASGIATGIAGANIAGLPPSWQAGIGVATFWLTKVGRYGQAIAKARAAFDGLFGVQQSVNSVTIDAPSGRDIGDAASIAQDGTPPPQDAGVAVDG